MAAKKNQQLTAQNEQLQQNIDSSIQANNPNPITQKTINDIQGQGALGLPPGTDVFSKKALNALSGISNPIDQQNAQAQEAANNAIQLKNQLELQSQPQNEQAGVNTANTIVKVSGVAGALNQLGTFESIAALTEGIKVIGFTAGIVADAGVLLTAAAASQVVAETIKSANEKVFLPSGKTATSIIGNYQAGGLSPAQAITQFQQVSDSVNRAEEAIKAANTFRALHYISGGAGDAAKALAAKRDLERKYTILIQAIAKQPTPTIEQLNLQDAAAQME